MSRRGREESYPRLDESSNTLVQLFNLLLESVAKDKKQLREDVAETYNRIVSTLSLYVDFSCLDPYTRYLLESNLMGDIILSHLEALDESEGDGKEKRNWLKLSGRTKALIAIALTRCSKHSRVSIEKSGGFSGLRVEEV